MASRLWSWKMRAPQPGMGCGRNAWFYIWSSRSKHIKRIKWTWAWNRWCMPVWDGREIQLPALSISPKRDCFQPWDQCGNANWSALPPPAHQHCHCWLSRASQGTFSPTSTFLCWHISLYIYLSIYLSVYLSIYLSCLSIYLATSIHLSTHLSVQPYLPPIYIYLYITVICIYIYIYMITYVQPLHEERNSHPSSCAWLASSWFRPLWWQLITKKMKPESTNGTCSQHMGMDQTSFTSQSSHWFCTPWWYFGMKSRIPGSQGLKSLAPSPHLRHLWSSMQGL